MRPKDSPLDTPMLLLMVGHVARRFEESLDQWDETLADAGA